MLRVTINHGLGIMLLYKPVFDYILQNRHVDRIEYAMPSTYLRAEYPNSFHENLLKIADQIMNDARIVQVDAPFTFTTVEELIARFQIPKLMPSCPSLFRSATPRIEGEYITLNMKVTDIQIPEFEKHLPAFVDILRKSKYKIVLTGERYLTPCREYDIHKNYMFSMYPMIRHLLPNCIDETYSETLVANDLETLQRSANLYEHSKYNVFINSSGGISFMAYFGHMIGMTTQTSPTSHVYDLNHSGNQLAHSIRVFLVCLQQAIC